MTTKGSAVEFVVVGAGATGLSAARSLARRGREVVVCEKGTVGHEGSGSKGSARIFRLGYDEPGYVRMAMVAKRLWEELEAESERSLLEMTGQITFGPELEILEEAMRVAGAAFESLEPDAVADRFPALSVPGRAVFEPESGVIAAGECLVALKETPGVEVREGTRVNGLADDGRKVRVVVETGGTTRELEAGAVVVCAGPWTAAVVGRFGSGLRALGSLEQVAYLAPAEGSDRSAVDGLPVFVERRAPWFYGLPVRWEGLVKISLHGAGPAVSLADLDDPGGVFRPDGDLLGELAESARRVLPGFGPDPVGSERCVYDNSPDGDFVVDRIGNVVIGSGTSGHGFKFAPLLGELLADLAQGKSPGEGLVRPDDVGRFSAGRLGSLGDGAGPRVHP